MTDSATEKGTGLRPASAASATGSDASSGSGSESSSARSSESGSESESESDAPLTRPIFVRKGKKAVPPPQQALAALAKAEHILLVAGTTPEKQPFDGADDTDDIDPADEYTQWKARERLRRERNRREWAAAEDEKENALRRKMGTGLEPAVSGSRLDALDAKSRPTGSFYASGLDEKFLKRDYSDVEREDHSRPTRYKR